MQPDGVNLWYFKFRLFDPTNFIVWNIKGLRHQVHKIKEIRKSKFVTINTNSLVISAVKVKSLNGLGSSLPVIRAPDWTQSKVPGFTPERTGTAPPATQGRQQMEDICLQPQNGEYYPKPGENGEPVFSTSSLYTGKFFIYKLYPCNLQVTTELISPLKL